MNKPLLAILLAISVTGVIYGAFASQETTAKATTSVAHTTAIRNVRLFDGERVVPHATVVWSDGRIMAVIHQPIDGGQQKLFLFNDARNDPIAGQALDHSEELEVVLVPKHDW